MDFRNREAVVRRSTSEWVFLRISQCSQENNCLGVSFMNMQAWRPATLLKTDSNIGIFLWNLRNFQEHLFLQNTFGACFWRYLMNSLFIAFENDEWWPFVVCTSSPSLISFYCVCFVSFYSFGVSRSELLKPCLVINVTGLVQFGKNLLHLTSTCLLELLAAKYLRETNMSIFISH